MKKFLLTTVFVLGAFSAQAQEVAARSYVDITNPFYIPEKSVMADSNVSVSRVKMDASINAPAQTGSRFLKNVHKYTASETLTYGITGTWAVYGSYTYDWMKKNGTSSFNERSWTIGTKVNTIEDAWRVQIGADVTRTDISKWKNVINPDQKDTHLYLMAGTETGEKVFAYTRFNYHDIEYGNNRRYNVYSIDAAMHISADAQTTADLGLQFKWDTMGRVRNRDLTFFADGYMALYQNVALGMKLDYVLASSNSIKWAFAPDNQGAYSFGVNLKYEF